MGKRYKFAFGFLLGTAITCTKKQQILDFLSKSKKNKLIAVLLCIIGIMLYKRIYSYKHVIINYLHKLIEKVLPEEYRPDLLSNKSIDFIDEDMQQAMDTSQERCSSCRKRILSVIKEESERDHEE
ncbi:unnamed protein product [Moneuplotes crassus]|uniref:Uncharacterized protein n=1 Tax=Euplotes crassus TaxID=5936 RepID=A0AAD1U684_EUPCR|nr:unnamed protein product [Moneuplotes crassus]